MNMSKLSLSMRTWHKVCASTVKEGLAWVVHLQTEWFNTVAIIPYANNNVVKCNICLESLYF